MLSIFTSPSRYVQGPDASQHLASELQYLGLDAPVFIITGNSAHRLLAKTWEQVFTAAKMPFEIYLFEGQCSQNEIKKAEQAAKKQRPGVIIGAGGGRILDAARAVAANLDLPVVSCPTVASSDAPCSALSVIYTDSGEFESFQTYRRNPDLVLLDSSIIAHSPPRLLAAGMGDALATLFEADTCVKNHVKNMRGGLPTQSSYALAKLCYKILLEDGVAAKEALAKQQVTPALERIIEANTLLSGLGFESCGLAAAHSINNGLTVIKEAAQYYHGERVAFGTLVQLVLENKPKALIEEVLNFASQTDLPMTLQQLGITNIDKAQVKKVAERSIAPEETIHNEPFAINEKMVTEAILEAQHIGEQYQKGRT